MKDRIFTKIKDFWKIKRNHKLMFLLFVIFVAGGVLLLNTKAFATGGSLLGDIAGDIVSALITFLSLMMQYLAQLCIRLALFFWQYFIQLSGYNDFMNAPPVTIGWVMIRDFANMFFIVALMVIAIGTVLGVEQYEWKKSLVKLIFAAIFINFSKLILQLVLDFAQVLMDTFLIAFANRSGTSLIKIFSMDNLLEIKNSSPYSMNQLYSGDFSGDGGIPWQGFIGSVVALIMALLVMATIATYLVVMIGRMIVLWMLMILSPLAFILSAFPFGKQYAGEFWKNFFNYAMVGPVMVFFTWLAFASLQAGEIAKNIGVSVSQLSGAGETTLVAPGYVSISKASTWENLASFFIAIGFFVIGITMVQRMGVVGGNLSGRAMDFTKRVATIASGYAAGRWLTGKGTGLLRRGGEAIGGGLGGMLKGELRLGYEKTGIPKRIHEKRMDKESRLGQMLNMSQRRRASLQRLEDLKLGRQRAIKATAGAGKWAPEEREVARQEKIAEELESSKQSRMARYKREAGAQLAKESLPEFAERKADLMSAELGIDVRTQFVNDKGENLWSNVEKAIEAGDVNAYEGSMKEIEDQVGIYSEIGEQAKAGNWEKVSELMNKTYAKEGYYDDLTALESLEKNDDGTFKDEEQAKKLFENFEKSNPLFANYSDLRKSFNTGERKDAIESLQKAIKLDPNNETLLGIRDDLLGGGNIFDAREKFEKNFKEKGFSDLDEMKESIIRNDYDSMKSSLSSFAATNDGYAAYKGLSNAIKRKDQGGASRYASELGSSFGIKGEYTQAMKRDIDRKAARGAAPVISRILEERAAEEMAGTEKSAIDTLKGMFDHSYLKQEQKIIKNREKVVDEELIKERLAKINTPEQKNTAYAEYAKGWLENLYSQYAEDVDRALKDPEALEEIAEKYDLGTAYGRTNREMANDLRGEITGQSKDKQKRILVSALEKMGANELEELETEIKEGGQADSNLIVRRIQEAKSHPAKVDDESVLRSYAQKLITDRERSQAYEDRGVYEGLDIIGGEFDEYKSGNRNRKYAKELEGAKGHVADVIRLQEGKASDRLRRWEEADTRERISDFDEYEYEKLVSLITRDAEQMRNYYKKKEAGQLDSKDKKAMESTSQNLSNMMAVMMKNFTGSMPSLIEGVNETFQGKDFDNGENIGKAVTALVTGADWDDVKDPGGFQKVENQMKSNFKEKQNRLMRVMAYGYQKASDNGFAHYYRQISEGKDKYGNDVFGNTVLMKDGIGDDTNLGTGKRGVMGKTYRDTQEREMLYPSRNFRSAADTRAFVQMKNGRGVAFRSKADEMAMRAVAELDANRINELSNNYLWSGFGGGYGESPYDGKNFDTSKDMKIVLGLTVKKIMDKYNTASNTITRQRELEKFRALLEKLGVDRIGESEVSKAGINDIVSFVNDKIVTGLEREKSELSGDIVERLEVTTSAS